MNKKTLMIVGAVILVVAVAGGVFFMSKDDTNDNSSQDSQTNQKSSEQTQNTEQSQTEQGNLFSIASGGKAQQCEMNYSGTNGSGTGKMYTDGKGRGLMTIDIKTEKGNTGQSNTLVTADKVYSWTTANGQTFGFVADKSKYTSSSSTSSASSADPNQKFDMNCQAWTIDESKLTVPSNVNFTALPV